MKITSWSSVVICLCLVAVSGRAQKSNASVESTDSVVVERGPHHRVFERTISEPQPDGTVRERKSSYTELATGLHYQNERGEWIESREEIEILNGVAVARQGQIQVIFAANANSAGAIDLLAPDGKRFRSHVLGLFYTDYASGRSVAVAEIKDSLGELTAPNQVTYPDAFDGDCVADLRYTVTKSFFEQDVVLRTAPPSPAEWGLNPETTRLEVFTEFPTIPEASVIPVMLKQETDPAARQTMKEPDLVDQRLNFGGLIFDQGQAFPLGAEADPFSELSVPTGKSLERIDGRLILIEKVDYPAVREHLGRLPKSASLNKDRKVGLPDPGRTMLARLLPSRPSGEAGKWSRKLQAEVNSPRAGFVLDYVAYSSVSLTNFCFKGDTTYFLTNSATVNLYGTTVIEGNTVLKFASSAIVNLRGPVDCRTAAYRPAYFTGKDDDTIGEVIAGSSGSPTNGAYGSGSAMLWMFDTTTTYDLHDLRFRYAFRAIGLSSNTKADLSHVQIGKGKYGIGIQGGAVSTCRNVLVHDISIDAFSLTGTPTNRSEHVTLHRVSSYRQTTNSGLFTVTNSMLISVTNKLVFQGQNNITNLSDTGIFQTVGSATHYLASGSTNRDAGTTNINATLLAELRKRTTYPPTVLTSAITNDTTLTAQAQRDTDTPDLGYHYDPLDYAGSQLAITNATLTLQAGTALGLYGSSSAYGLLLLDGGKIVSEGTPDTLNRIVRYNLVQEPGVTNWSATTVSKSISTPGTYSTNTYAGEVRLRFTEFSMPANGSDHLYLGATNLTVDVRDCQFHGGQLTIVRPHVTLLNNLFARVAFKLYSPVNAFSALVRNGTYIGGSLTLSNAAVGGWNFKDNLFDTTNLVQVGFVTNNYNGYLTNSIRLTNNGANDVLLTVTNITYETGWLGRFYLPTNLTSHTPLFGSGSQNATNAGLYHYTMVTNQTRELSTTVDLGFHYVAVGTSGTPLDTDGDGLANYYEDANGNGSVDSGETDWQTYESVNGLSGGQPIQVFTPLK